MSKALTALAVEKLRPDRSKRLEIPDGLLPGLYLVVQPSGRKSWAVRYRAAGKSRKLTLGGYPVLDLAEAREAARAALQGAQKGGDPAREKAQDRRAAKRGIDRRDAFESVARQFLERYAKPKNRSWRETARLLGLKPDPTKPKDADKPGSYILVEGGLAARWAGVPMHKLARRDILDVLDEIVDRGAPIIANRTLAAVRKLCAWGVDRDIIPANPATGVKPPSPETSRDRVLTDVELRAVWLAADEIGWPFGPLTQILILTGQRREEVAQMSRAELAGEVWTLPRERSKNDSAHGVPLPARARAILEGLPKIGDRGLIFTTNGSSPVSGFSKAKDNLDAKAVAILRKEAEKRGENPEAVTMAPWRLHDIRRTVATGLARLGVAIHVVERILNHVSGTISGVAAVYNRHTYEDEVRCALDAWGSFIEDLVSGSRSSNVVSFSVARS